jgi:hypothetical protein
VSESRETITVYELIDADRLVENATRIGELLFRMPRGGVGRSFAVSPICGWLLYSDHTQLRRSRRKRRLPDDAAAARAAARRFLAAAAAQAPALRALGLPPLFPAQLEDAETTLVFHPRLPQVDHWLCRLTPHLSTRTADNESVPVIGSSIDLRIGELGEVIGLSSRWRPCVRGLSRPATAHPERAGVGATHSQPPQQVYLLAGQNAPQRFLAPYWIETGEEHPGLIPASDCSLLATIVELERADGVELWAAVAGGSGQYDLSWATWSLLLPQDGFRELGSTLSVFVPLGVHNVALNVQDRATGAITQTQSTVYARGDLDHFAAESRPSRVRPGCTDPTASNYDPNANFDDGSCQLAGPSV